MSRRGEPQVRAFAEAMIAKLERRAHHGDWREKSSLLQPLRDEIRELQEALYRSPRDQDAVAAILDECVDVANYAMMIADQEGALPREEVPDESPAKSGAYFAFDEND